MYQYAAQSRHATGNFRLRYRILLVAVIVLGPLIWLRLVSHPR